MFVILDEIRSERPADVVEELSPGHTVIMDVNDVVDLVVHVGSLSRLDVAMERAGRDLFVVVGRFELFTLSIYVEREVRVVMRVGNRVRSKSDTEQDDRGQDEASSE
jgi:hypothetical protein